MPNLTIIVGVFLSISLCFAAPYVNQRRNLLADKSLRSQILKDHEHSLSYLMQSQRFLRRQISTIVCDQKSKKGILTTGAWCLYPDMARPSHISTVTSIPEGKYPIAKHHVRADEGIARALFLLFQNLTVLDMGAGIGQYGIRFAELAALEGSGLKSYAGYDGAINVEEYTHNYITWADFSLPFRHSTETDWTLCLEVGEHVAPEYENILIESIVASSKRCGIILSWGIPKQDGHGHVNLKTNNEIIQIFTAKGFIYDAEFSMNVRSNVTYSWFKNTFMRFNKKDAPETCTK